MNIKSLEIDGKTLEYPDNEYYQIGNGNALCNITSGSKTIDLSSYIPEGKKVILDYTIHLWGSNSECHLLIGSDISPQKYIGSIFLVYNHAGENNNVSGTIPVGSERKVTLSLTGPCGGCEFRVFGYRIVEDVVSV